MKFITAFTMLCALFTLAPYSWSISESEYNERIESLNNKIDKLDKKSKKRDKSTLNKFDKYLKRLKIDGFASAGLSTSDVDAAYILGVNDTKNYQLDAVVGFQPTFQVNDKTKAVLQFVGRGGERNNLIAEWAYISHAFSPNLTGRAGRLRVPYYVGSEYLEVGFAYPWVRPPVDIYSQLPFTSYYGIDTFYNFNLFGWQTTFQAFNGIDEFEMSGANYIIETMYGAYFTFSRGPWSIRIGNTVANGVLEGDFEFDISNELTSTSEFTDFVATLGPLISNLGLPFSTPDEQYLVYLAYELYNANTDRFGTDLLTGFNAAGAALEREFSLETSRTEFGNFGISFDNGTWLMLLEATYFDFTGQFVEIDAHYATLGRRFNQILPYFLFSHAYTTNEGYLSQSIGSLIPAVVNGLGFSKTQQKTYAVGVRWDLAPGIAVKFQADHMTDMDGTDGKFLTNPGNDADLFSIVIDVVY